MTKDEILATYRQQNPEAEEQGVQGETPEIPVGATKDEILAAYKGRAAAVEVEEPAVAGAASVDQAVQQRLAQGKYPKTQQFVGAVYNALASIPAEFAMKKAKTGPAAIANVLENKEKDFRNRLFSGGPVTEKELEWYGRGDKNMAVVIESRRRANKLQIVQADPVTTAKAADAQIKQEENKIASQYDYTVPLPEAKTRGEKLAATGGGAVGIVARLAFLKKTMPGMPAAGLWEMENQMHEGSIPGEGALMYALMAGAGKVAKLPQVAALPKAARGAVGVAAETAGLAAIPAAKQLATGEEQDWTFLALPALLRTPGVIRAGWNLGSKSLPNIRDIMPIEGAAEMTEGARNRAGVGPTLENAEAMRATRPRPRLTERETFVTKPGRPGTQRGERVVSRTNLPEAAQASQGVKTKAPAGSKIPKSSTLEKLDNAAAMLYDQLVDRAAAGDKAAAQEIARLGTGRGLPTYGVLARRARNGDQRAARLLMDGHYQGGENGATTAFRAKALPFLSTAEQEVVQAEVPAIQLVPRETQTVTNKLLRSLLVPPTPRTPKQARAARKMMKLLGEAEAPAVNTKPEARATKAEQAFAPETVTAATAPEVVAGAKEGAGGPLAMRVATTNPSVTGQRTAQEARSVSGVAVGRGTTPSGLVEPSGGPLGEAITKLLEWAPQAEIFTKGKVARAVRALHERQARTASEVYKDALKRPGTTPEQAAAAARASMSQKAKVPDYPAPKITNEGWSALKSKAAEVHAGKPFDQQNAIDAIEKVRSGHWLARHEFELLDPVLGREATEALWRLTERAHGVSMWDRILRIKSYPKVLLVGFDIQVPYQSPAMWSRHPVLVTKAVGRTVKSHFSTKELEDMEREVQESPDYAESAHFMPYLSDKPWKNTERFDWFRTGGAEGLAEMGAKSGTVVKAAGAPARAMGRVAMRAERRAVAGINYILHSLWTQEKAAWAKEGLKGEELVARQAAFGKHVSALMRLVHAKSRTGAEIQRAANLVMFSPSTTISKPMQMINIFTNKGYRLDAGLSVGLNIAKMFGIGMLVNSVGGLYESVTGKDPGVSVNLNPLNSAFAKIRVGDTYYDLTYGDANWIRTLVRLSVAAEVQGELMGLGRIGTTMGGERIPEIWETLASFATSKEAPDIGLVKALLTGKDFMGNPISLPTAVANGLAPEQIQIFYRTLKDEGILQASLAAVVSELSVPVITYKDTPSKLRRQAHNNLAQEAHGKAWDDLTKMQQTLLRVKNRRLLQDLDASVTEWNASHPRDISGLKEEELTAGQLALSKAGKAVKKAVGDLPVGIGRTQGNLRLNDTRYNTLIKYVATELRARIAGEQLDKLDPKVRRATLAKRIKEAKRIAWLRTQRDLKLY